MLFLREGDNTQEMMLEKFNVKELVEFERFCKDNAMWEGMRNCYAKNCSVNISWFNGTGNDFIETSSKMSGHAPHKLYNVVVRLSKNKKKAAALIMMTIDRAAMIEKHPAEVHSDAKILYRTEKIDGVWKIISLDGIYQKDSISLKYPSKDVSIDLDAMKNYRPSVASATYVTEKAGGKTNSKMFVADEPERVQKLFDETEAWLNQ